MESNWSEQNVFAWNLFSSDLSSSHFLNDESFFLCIITIDCSISFNKKSRIENLLRQHVCSQQQATFMFLGTRDAQNKQYLR